MRLNTCMFLYLESVPTCIFQHSNRISVYVFFCLTVRSLIFILVQNPYGFSGLMNMTGFCWRSRQDHARETFYLTVDSINIVTTHSLLSKWQTWRNFFSCFSRRGRAVQTNWSLCHSYYQGVGSFHFPTFCRSNQPGNSGPTTWRIWQLTLSLATKWPRYFSQTRARLCTIC